MLVLCLVAAGLLPGCEESQPVYVAPPPNLSSIDLLNDQSGQLEFEEWYVHKVGGHKIGHRRVQHFQATVNGLPKTHQFVTDDLEMPRFGSVTRQILRTASRLDADGNVEMFEYRLDNGRNSRRLAALVVGQQLSVSRFEGNDLNAEVKSEQDWNPENLGLFAIENSLRRNPLASGERRSLFSWTALVDQTQTVHLTAGDKATVSVAGQQRQLVPVEVRAKQLAPGASSTPDAVYWINDQGKVELISRTFLGQTTCLSTKVEAMQPNDQVDFDITNVASVPADLPSDFDGEKTTAALVIPVLNSVDAAQSIVPASAYQRQDARNPAEVSLAVQMPAFEDPGQWEAPTSLDVQPNRWIDFESRLIRQFADLSGDSPPPTTVGAVLDSLHEKVYTGMRKDDLNQVLVPASVAAKSGSGDCTEHAMLLAAVIRANGVPARVAIGLILDVEQSRFVFHMWTEAWVGDHWRPLDSTRKSPIPSPWRIKLGDTSLASDSDYAVIEPVITFVSRVNRQRKIQISTNSNR